MEQKEFFELLKKYRRGEASTDEKRIIDGWYEMMGVDLDKGSNLKEEELARSYWRSIQSEIAKEKVLVPVQSFHERRIWKYTVGIAASLLVAVTSFLFLSHDNNPVKIERLVKNDAEILVAESWKQIENTNSTAQKYILPDGSSVTLKPSSAIRIADEFNTTTREIYLEGEAFFQVAHDKKRPFLVHANSIITKVLGTSFTVKAFKNDKNIVVSVNTGKVSVYKGQASTNDQKAEVILTPNQQIVYDTKKETISRQIVEAPQPILQENEMKRTLFKAAPVSEIFEAIEDIYGIEVEFDEALSSCKLTTSITDGDLYNRLTIITNAIGATYTLNENKIVVTGSGCN